MDVKEKSPSVSDNYSREMQEKPSPTQTDDCVAVIADDDDGFRETLAIWIRDEWTVREAATGTEALTALDSSVDVLVLDRQMPDLCGPEVFEQLDDTGFDGNVIVVSTYQPDDHLGETDVAEYLLKPVTSAAVLEKIDRHC